VKIINLRKKKKQKNFFFFSFLDYFIYKSIYYSIMDTGIGDKSSGDNDLYSPQTDSFWEVCINICTKKN
jgi:hypothetical protein